MRLATTVRWRRRARAGWLHVCACDGPHVVIDHLVLIPGRVRELELKCKCGEYASRFIRCGKCKAVVSRCGSHGDNMEREASGHC